MRGQIHGVNNSVAQIAFISDMWFLHPPLKPTFTKELKINTLHALLSLPHPKIPVHCKICNCMCVPALFRAVGAGGPGDHCPPPRYWQIC